MTHKTHRNSLVKMFFAPTRLLLTAWILAMAANNVHANPPSVSPPPPPKPLNSNSTSTSPAPAPKSSTTEPFTNSNSASPVNRGAPAQPATPATSPSGASLQPGARQNLAPETAPAATKATETQETTETTETTETQQLENLIKTEVSQAVASRNNWFYAMFGAMLIMIGGTWVFLWLLRQNLTKIVLDEIQQKISGQLKAEIGEQIKAEISAEFVETLAQQRNNSALAIAQPTAKAIDNSTQINELISMAVATNNLLQETRNALEESRKLHERISQPIQEIFGIYFKQATELLQQGEYEAAIEMYDKTLQTNPDFYEAWLGRGIAFSRLQQYETAIGCYNKALQINSDHPEPWYEKARCYAIKKDIDLVIDNLQRAININPNIRQIVQQDPDFEIILDHEIFTQTS